MGSSPILFLSNLFSDYLNFVILLVAIFELFLACISGFRLSGAKIEIQKLNKGSKQGRTSRRHGKGKRITTYSGEEEKDFGEFNDFLQSYQKKMIVYNAFSLLIQIFTLLGILGTVAGLYIAIYNEQDIYEGVKFALSSTIYGIMAAVFFKVIDIIITSTLINYIDDGIEIYKMNFDVASSDSMMDAMTKNNEDR